MKLCTTYLMALSLLITNIVLGHSGATGIVNERMDAMADMSDQSKLVADMFKGKTEFSKSLLIETADTFVQHGTAMIELFPDSEESRTGSNTEALPRIWDNWEDFNKQVLKFVEQSEKLKDTASETEDVGQLKKAFFKVANGCRDCHKKFRKPKN